MTCTERIMRRAGSSLRSLAETDIDDLAPAHRAALLATLTPARYDGAGQSRIRTRTCMHIAKRVKHTWSRDQS